MQFGAWFHQVRHRLELIETEAVNNQLKIRALTQRDGTFVSVPCHLDPEQPMEFTEVGYLHMLLYVMLELINLIQGRSSNSAIVNVNNNNNELTGLATPEVDSLINGTLGESQLVNEDLH